MAAQDRPKPMWRFMGPGQVIQLYSTSVGLASIVMNILTLFITLVTICYYAP